MYLTLSRPGAEHPGPPQDFLGRKSFAETEGKGRKRFVILVMFLPLALPKPRAKEGETYTGIPAPRQGYPDIFVGTKIPNMTGGGDDSRFRR